MSVANLVISPASVDCALAQGDWEVEGVEAPVHLALGEALAMAAEVAVHEEEDPLVAVIHLAVDPQHIVVKNLLVLIEVLAEISAVAIHLALRRTTVAHQHIVAKSLLVPMGMGDGAGAGAGAEVHLAARTPLEFVY